MPMLIIVGNGVEAGNLALSDTDQLCGVIKLSGRSIHTPKKVKDVGNVPNPHPARRTPAGRPWRSAAQRQHM
jgi:hypothetical protein